MLPTGPITVPVAGIRRPVTPWATTTWATDTRSRKQESAFRIASPCRPVLRRAGSLHVCRFDSGEAGRGAMASGRVPTTFVVCCRPFNVPSSPSVAA
ncbi:hypothetical protein GCM10010219_40160 [Streptomyces netropsis]|nr:hypothetical protein GCM10010219_40160 [Streptomyces netropsis]